MSFTSNNCLKTIDLERMTIKKVYENLATTKINSVTYMNNDEYLVMTTGENSLIIIHSDNTFKMNNISTSPIKKITVNANEKVLAALCEDSSVILFDVTEINKTKS